MHRRGAPGRGLQLTGVTAAGILSEEGRWEMGRGGEVRAGQAQHVLLIQGPSSCLSRPLPEKDTANASLGRTTGCVALLSWCPLNQHLLVGLPCVRSSP